MKRSFDFYCRIYGCFIKHSAVFANEQLKDSIGLKVLKCQTHLQAFSAMPVIYYLEFSAQCDEEMSTYARTYTW